MKEKILRKKDQILIQDYFRWNPQARERIESMGIDTGWVKGER